LPNPKKNYGLLARVWHNKDMLVTRDTPSHWYDTSGKPVHRVPYADKKRAGETRPTNLTDARRMTLYPSVTNILKGGLPNDSLNSWKIEQGILAALTLPQNEGETLDDFARRVVQDMDSVAGKAADFGSAVHSAIEDYVLGGVEPTREDLANHWPLIRSWVDSNIERVLKAESVLVNPAMGYAGTVDLVATPKGALRDAANAGVVIIDFKTRNPYKGKFAVYETDKAQLAAYGEALAMDNAVGVSVFIGRDVPASPVARVYSEEERERGMEIFKAAFNTWKLLKNYDPSSK